MNSPDNLKPEDSLKPATKSGLSSAEARRRLKEFGFNEPVTTHKRRAILTFLRLFAEPLIIILLIASAISGFVGDWLNAVIIWLMVFLGVILNFVQTSRSEKAASSLQKEISLTAAVLRDGVWSEIPPPKP